MENGHGKWQTTGRSPRFCMDFCCFNFSRRVRGTTVEMLSVKTDHERDKSTRSWGVYKRQHALKISRLSNKRAVTKLNDRSACSVCLSEFVLNVGRICTYQTARRQIAQRALQHYNVISHISCESPSPRGRCMTFSSLTTPISLCSEASTIQVCHRY